MEGTMRRMLIFISLISVFIFMGFAAGSYAARVPREPEGGGKAAVSGEWKLNVLSNVAAEAYEPEGGGGSGGEHLEPTEVLQERYEEFYCDLTFKGIEEPAANQSAYIALYDESGKMFKFEYASYYVENEDESVDVKIKISNSDSQKCEHAEYLIVDMSWKPCYSKAEYTIGSAIPDKRFVSEKGFGSVGALLQWEDSSLYDAVRSQDSGNISLYVNGESAYKGTDALSALSKTCSIGAGDVLYMYESDLDKNGKTDYILDVFIYEPAFALRVEDSADDDKQYVWFETQSGKIRVESSEIYGNSNNMLNWFYKIAKPLSANSQYVDYISIDRLYWDKSTYYGIMEMSWGTEYVLTGGGSYGVSEKAYSFAEQKSWKNLEKGKEYQFIVDNNNICYVFDTAGGPAIVTAYYPEYSQVNLLTTDGRETRYDLDAYSAEDIVDFLELSGDGYFTPDKMIMLSDYRWNPFSGELVEVWTPDYDNKITDNVRFEYRSMYIGENETISGHLSDDYVALYYDPTTPEDERWEAYYDGYYEGEYKGLYDTSIDGGLSFVLDDDGLISYLLLYGRPTAMEISEEGWEDEDRGIVTKIDYSKGLITYVWLDGGYYIDDFSIADDATKSFLYSKRSVSDSTAFLAAYTEVGSDDKVYISALNQDGVYSVSPKDSKGVFINNSLTTENGSSSVTLDSDADCLYYDSSAGKWLHYTPGQLHGRYIPNGFSYMTNQNGEADFILLKGKPGDLDPGEDIELAYMSRVTTETGNYYRLYFLLEEGTRIESYPTVYTSKTSTLGKKFEQLFTRFQNGTQPIPVRPIFDTNWEIKAISFT